MRILFAVVLFPILSSVLWGQSLLAKRTFAEGTQLATSGEFGKALKAYKIVSSAEGDAGEFGVKVRYNLGVCYYRVGQLKAARAELNSAIRLSGGQHQRAFYALGMTESALENWPAAKSAFLASLALAPKDGEAWFDLALVYLAEHDYDNAAAAFRKSIESRSVDSAAGHNNLGVIMAIKLEYDAAERAFDAALNLTSGRLIEARKNLEICKILRARRTEMVARVELSFARRQSPGMLAPSPA